MKWDLSLVAVAVLAVAALSRRLTGTPVTAPMVFALLGLIAGPLITDELKLASNGGGVRTLAEATLAVYERMTNDE